MLDIFVIMGLGKSALSASYFGDANTYFTYLTMIKGKEHFYFDCTIEQLKDSIIHEASGLYGDFNQTSKVKETIAIADYSKLYNAVRMVKDES
jgi:hypothetical protein